MITVCVKWEPLTWAQYYEEHRRGYYQKSETLAKEFEKYERQLERKKTAFYKCCEADKLTLTGIDEDGFEVWQDKEARETVTPGLKLALVA